MERRRGILQTITTNLVVVMATVATMAGEELAPPPPAPADAGFVTIFDGRSLDGWIEEATPGSMPHGDDRPAWTVESDTLACNGLGFGFLRYARREFADFTLRAEFQLPERSNSGIGIRTCPFDAVAGAGTRPSFHAYEIQFLNDSHQPPSPKSSGSLYRYVAPTVNAIKPPGEWNLIEVTCRGPRIRIRLNGQEIQDFDQTTLPETRDKPLRGYICLQNHCSPVRFKHLRIRDEAAIHEAGEDPAAH